MLNSFISPVFFARKKGNQKLYCAFIDLEKAYDRIPREVMFGFLRKRKVPEQLVRLVEMMYKNKVKSNNRSW